MNGKYWDKPWSLVDGCTPCSPGCDHCWSAAMTHRFTHPSIHTNMSHVEDGLMTTCNGHFNGIIRTRPDRLSIPLKCRKPTVYAVWNDLFHEDVPDDFINRAFEVMEACKQHTFLVLSKRPGRMSTVDPGRENIYHGLTVCNQQEADEKILTFFQVPGKIFLSIEPMLGPIDFRKVPGFNRIGMDLSDWNIILGGETGPGARPCHPDWVRSVRDPCAAAGVPFYFKGWGEWTEYKGGIPSSHHHVSVDGKEFIRVGRKNSGRLLDGREHNDLPWRNEQ
jgi:protein gp37